MISGSQTVDKVQGLRPGFFSSLAGNVDKQRLYGHFLI